MSNESLLKTRLDGVHILYDAGRLHQPRPNLFDPDQWRRDGRLIGEASGRGRAYFLRADSGSGEEEWVLRHYRRGGFIARFNQDSYLYTGLERSRPFRELRLLALLREWSLPVPPPVAAGLICRGGFYRADLMTVRVPGQPLSSLLLSGQAGKALFEAVGEVIGRFHARGVFHADLNAHNILVADEGIHVIDLDRGRLRSPGGWQRANLDRLHRSMKKVLGEEWSPYSHWPEYWLALEKRWQKARLQSGQ
jgi:3-deoxy-D-manno-octulosonic acid kinase